MKTGLVMEGGSMRGMFTAGVTDVLMENGIEFDGGVGVSAGAVFGCNVKSNQPGRAIRYNKKYCRDPRYVSVKSLIFTGNMYGEKFCYHDLPEKLDPFDSETFKNSNMEFFVVATDVKTGEAVYHKCEKGKEEDLLWMRASAALPLFAKIVEIDGRFLSDGGSADSVPLKFLQSKGYEKNVVILTQPEGFVKQKTPHLKLIKLLLWKYPALVKTLEKRHEMYNETLKYVKECEKKGEVFVIRPPEALNIGAVERNPDELERVYQTGRKTAEKELEKIKMFMK